MIVGTTLIGILWTYAGTTVDLGKQVARPVVLKAPTLPPPKVNAVTRQFCDRMHRDFANDAVEYDPDGAFDIAMITAWDADCRTLHGIKLLK